MRSSETPYERIEPVLSPLNVTDKRPGASAATRIHNESLHQTQQRSEPVWSANSLAELEVEQPAHELPQPRQLSKSGYGSYRLIDWLSAMGLLAASFAIAFGLNRNLF
jgi:hypothetical protein